ncbi:MAG: LysM peptidoglycan-binding domain-containing M23 family metallopeptidase [Anaeromyxobacteraceae bacterium]
MAPDRAARLAVAAALLASVAGCVHPPARGPAPERAEVAGPHVEPDVVGVVHVVRRGETVYRIARTYALSPDELMEVNGVEDPRDLEVGMELFVPGAMQVLEVPAASAADPVPLPRAKSRPATAAATQTQTPTPTPTSTPTSTPTPTRHPSPTAPQTAKRPPLVANAESARLGWPVQGLLYSRYGLREGQRHDGIDIAAPEGTPVGAAAAGTVVYAGRQAGYGAIVILRHAAGLLTVYAHASALLVEQGQAVAAGQPIAKVGRSGRTTGPHLHFEVREGTRPRNPLLYLP